MSVSEPYLITDTSDSYGTLTLGVIASLNVTASGVLGNTFSSLTLLSHEMVNRFQSMGLSLNSFSVVEQKIFVSLSLSQNDETSLGSTFAAINKLASKHGVQLDFNLVDINDPNQIASNRDLTEVKTSVATLLPKKERFSKVELFNAINEKKFAIHCQPLVDISTSRMKGIEFLVRWEHAEYGMLYPDSFLPEIERFGLETDLDLLILEEALSQLKKWEASRKFGKLSISVNLYSCSLVSQRLVRWLSKMADTNPLLVSKLILEITETGHIEDGGIAHNNMKYLQSLGFSVSLDDFGAGTTICSYLTYLNPNEIKIDRALMNTAFSRESNKSRVALKMLRSMIGWVQEMENVDLVVEGIESLDQLEYLKGLGVSVGQGYVYSKPLPVNQLLESCKGI